MEHVLQLSGLAAKDLSTATGNASQVTELSVLIERLQGGDDTALEPLIAETEELAYRLAYSFVRDAHLAQDVCQDVYLVVYRDLGKLRDPLAFRTWFCRIVANRCRRYLRRLPTRPLEHAPEPSRSGLAERVSDRLQLQAALAQLPDLDREILGLREALQLSYAELAEVLDIPVGTVRSRLSKARLRLYQALTERENSNG